MHKYITNLPILIFWYWLFCSLFLLDNKFYNDNFELLDYIDTLIVLVATIHFIFYLEKYDKVKINYFKGIYFIILLNFTYEYLNEIIYYFLYYTIIAIFTIKTIWNIQTRK